MPYYRVNVNELVEGRTYHICDKKNRMFKDMFSVAYVGSFNKGTRTYYRFTFGKYENWKEQFGYINVKSNMNIFEFRFND